MDNLNILVEAKKEYLGQMCLIMCPPMIEVFQDMYNESVSLSKGRKVLIMFQKLLKEVPNWSNAMSKNHSDNITNRCAWFNDLLAAVFVACTKILSSVRLKADNKKISLKLPTEEVFIQTCYNNIAKDIYKDPYVFSEEQSEYLRDEKLTMRFTLAIESTVKEPMMEHDPEPTGLENEFKTVPGVQAPQAEVDAEPEPSFEPQSEPQPQHKPEGDDDVLFGDAPEQRTKNPRYN